ncbi:putative D,D-dipeptide-binding periplasmic protein DdpA [Koleobacter methoxysyntrophicus]|uniref:Putative D,D-dipeptide-binding periplasmic protein DdpA n=1 Tax=Koleobacter methoxysyntrophicus TaxID=2751313 RepID=A0A8A0RLX6_9FIRM|nr:putative D,D-dipeptide-binding periplasmic protein DdpA [Koleobacter methoxysyntrophicus]
MRKISVFVLVCTLLIALIAVGCGQKQQDSGTVAQPKIAVYAYGSEPVIYWDPSDTFSNEIIVMNNIYEQLLRYDPIKDEYIYLLATDFDVKENATVWTFKLREGVKFHCGEEFDANAVKYSIERTIERGQGASFIWEPVDEVNVIDKYTVEFKLKYPAALDMIASAGYTAHIFCPKCTEEKRHDWFVQGNACGTGPYMLESWERGNEVVLAKFNDYWGGWSEKNFDKAIIKMIPETGTRRQMLEAGHVDIVHTLPFEDLRALKNNPKIEVITTPSFQNMLGLLNTEKPPLDNKLVRQAISYAVPYKDIVQHVMSGFAEQSRGPIPRNLWGHKEDLFQYEHNLEKAKELLKKAGYENGFKLLLTYTSGDENERKSAELLKAELKKLNIDLEIRGMPWDAQWEMAKATNPKDRQDILLFYWWPDYADPFSYLNSLFHSEDEIVFNLSYWKNEEFDRLIDEANRISGADREEAIRLYGKAQEILVEEAPAVFFFDQMFGRAKLQNFKGYYDNPLYTNVVFFYETYREE